MSFEIAEERGGSSAEASMEADLDEALRLPPKPKPTLPVRPLASPTEVTEPLMDLNLR